MLTFEDFLVLSETTDKFIYPFFSYQPIGGDGTDGIMNDNVLNRLKYARGIIMHKDIDTTNPDSNFHIGDIVYCEGCKEHGIILGEKPSGLLKTLVKEYNSILAGNRKKGDRTYVVLTLELVDKDSENYDFRIRYVPTKRMKLYDRFEPVEGSTNDLENFCTKQCIMECSKDCYLYKYFKNKQIK